MIQFQEEAVKSKTRSKDKNGEKKKHLPFQQEKTARISIDDRIWAFIQALRTTDPKLCVNGLKK